MSVFSAEISNSTISGNSYLGPPDCQVGSGVNAAQVLISHSTIAGNAEIDLSYGRNEVFWLPKPCREYPRPDPPYICLTRLGDPVIVENSIIEGSCVNPGTGNRTFSGGGNVESPGNTCLFDDLTDQVNVFAFDLGLDVLADNGGPTETHALLPSSIAIDTAQFSPCPETDQRGVERPQGAACDIGAYESELIQVVIDIKPGSDPNSINLADEGVIPAAILGSDDFDVADVDLATLAFGPDGASPAHCHGPHVADVDGDDLLDLLGHFQTQETGIEFGTLIACIEGATQDGKPFNGCDAVRTVPDMDGDGLLDLEEATFGTNALDLDTDGDGFEDGEEVLMLGTDPLNAYDPAPVEKPKRRGRRRR